MQVETTRKGTFKTYFTIWKSLYPYQNLWQILLFKCKKLILFFFLYNPVYLNIFLSVSKQRVTKKGHGSSLQKLKKSSCLANKIFKKKNDIFCSGCNCVEISECYPVYIDIYWISHNILRDFTNLDSSYLEWVLFLSSITSTFNRYEFSYINSFVFINMIYKYFKTLLNKTNCIKIKPYTK